MSLLEYDLFEPDRTDHRRNYREIQTAVFGQDEVDQLGGALRKFISRKLLKTAIERLMDQGKMISVELIADELFVDNIIVRKWIKEDPVAKDILEREKAFAFTGKIIEIVESQIKENRAITLSFIASRMGLTSNKLNSYINADEDLKRKIVDAQARQKAFKESRKIKYILGLSEKDILDKESFYEDMGALNEILTDMSILSKEKDLITFEDLVSVNKRGLSEKEMHKLINSYPAIAQVMYHFNNDGSIKADHLSDEFRGVNTILDKMLVERINISKSAVQQRLPGYLRKKEIKKKIFDDPFASVKLEIVQQLRNRQKENEKQEILNKINSKEDFMDLVREKLDISDRNYDFYRKKYLGGESVTYRSLADEYGVGRGVPGPIIKGINARVDRTPLLKAAKNKVENLDQPLDKTAKDHLITGSNKTNEKKSEKTGGIAKGSLFDKLNKISDINELEELLPRVEIDDLTINQLPISYVQAIKRAALLLPDDDREKYIDSKVNNAAVDIEDALERAAEFFETNEEQISSKIFKFPFAVDKKIEIKKLLNDLFDPGSSIHIHLFNARSEGPDNYIVGFNKVIEGKRYLGLSIEMIFFLADSPELLAEYIFHELMCGVLFEHEKLIKFQRNMFNTRNDLKLTIRNVLNEAGIDNYDILEDIDKWFVSSGAKKEIIKLMTEYGIPIDPEKIEDPRYIILFMSSIAFDESLEEYFNDFFAFTFDYGNGYVDWGQLLSHLEEMIFDPEAELDLPLSIFLELWYHWNERIEAWDDVPISPDPAEDLDIPDKVNISVEKISEEAITVRARMFKAYLDYIGSQEPESVFVIAFDTDLGPEQSASIMKLWRLIDDIEGMKDTNGNNMFPNMKILRGSGSKGELNEAIQSLMEEESVEKIKPENIIIVSCRTNVEKDIFNKYINSAWITEIDDTDSGFTGYVPVFESATLTIMAAMGADIEAINDFYNEISLKPISSSEMEEMILNRQFVVLPKIIKMNTGKELRKLYKSVRRIYTAA